MELLRLFLIGIAVGIANIIPGVSGGTLVVVFNIYDKFVNAITLNLKKLWENKAFVLPLLLGMGCGIAAFSKVISILYEKFPLQTNYFFMGLILGSLPLLFSFIKKSGEKSDASSGRNIKISIPKAIAIAACILAGCAILVAFTLMEGGMDKDAAKMAAKASLSLPEIKAGILIKLFVAGVLGAVAMVVPGISGSLLLLILGAYTTILSAISSFLSFEISSMIHAGILLVPVALGVLTGLLGGAKIIGIILKKVPSYAYSVIFGLLLGSVYAIFPGIAFSGIISFFACLLCIVSGFFLAFLSSKSGE